MKAIKRTMMAIVTRSSTIVNAERVFIRFRVGAILSHLGGLLPARTPDSPPQAPSGSRAHQVAASSHPLGAYCDHILGAGVQAYCAPLQYRAPPFRLILG